MRADPLMQPDCPRELLRARIAELEAEVTKLRGAVSRRGGWSDAEDAIVRHGYERGYKLATIRGELVARGHRERSTSSIGQRATSLGLVPSRPPNYWTADEDAIVRAAYEAGDSIAMIRRKLLEGGFSRKFGAIQMRLIHLGISGARVNRWQPEEEAIALAGLAGGRLHQDIIADLAKRGFERTEASLNKLATKHDLLRRPKLWTDEEKRRLAELYRSETSVRRVSDILGRDPSAVVTMASKLGLKIREPWTEAQNEQLIETARSGGRLVDVAKVIGRPYANVAAQARRLGLSFQKMRAAA